MSDRLQGKKIAFLTANEGVEQVELVEPLEAVRGTGAEGVHEGQRQKASVS